MLKRPADGFWAGLVVGIITVTVLMFFHVDINSADRSHIRPVETSDQAAQAFVSAWRNMVYGTWSVRSTYTRQITGGPTYRTNLHNVQSPPDYLNESGTSTSASINGQLYVCASVNQSSVSACRDIGNAPPYSVYAQNRINAVRALVGEARTYSVESENSDCFQLFLNAGRTANTWGNHARFCFDSRSGAMVSSAIDQTGVSDVTVADQITAPLPSDLKIPVS
jgi:hypothetical protein